MVHSNGVQVIRDAMAAMNAGTISLVDLERLVRDEIAAGSVSRLEASATVQSAFKAGRLSSDAFKRLVPDGDTDRPDQYAQSARRAALETRVRITGAAGLSRTSTAGQLRQTAAANVPTSPAPSQERGPAGTDALWVEPDPQLNAATTHTMVGQLLGGRYLLERELGGGGMGVVYLATDQEVAGEVFAIKVLKPEIRDYPEALPLLREEVRTTRALRHPNIVGVYSLNSDRSNIFMLMEYLEGKPLDVLLDEEFGRGMPFNRAWPLIQDMCDALAYAHDHNVIHSDLKPSNVFITTAGKAKLLDFGIARVARTRDGRFDPATVGALTLAYSSCEMLEGRKPDQGDDVFALACLIYEMLTGKHPFDLHSAIEARAAGDKVAPIATLSPGQNAALVRALAFSRADRTPTVEALLAGLDPAASSRDRGDDSTRPRDRRTTIRLGPAPPDPAEVPRRRPPQHWMVLAIAAISIVVVGGVGLLVYRARERSAGLTPAVKPASPAPSAFDTPPPPPAATVETHPPIPIPAHTPPVVANPAPAVALPNPSVGVDRNPPEAKLVPQPESMPGPNPATKSAGHRGDLPVASLPATPKTQPAMTVKPNPAPPTAATAAAAGESTPATSPPEPAAQKAELPPVAKHVAPVKPLPESEASIDACPYPPQALREGRTGSVGLLIYISPDGSAENTQVAETSGSDALDEAAVKCIQEKGLFSPKRVGARSVAYWGHMRFNWSFGG